MKFPISFFTLLLLLLVSCNSSNDNDIESVAYKMVSHLPSNSTVAILDIDIPDEFEPEFLRKFLMDVPGVLSKSMFKCTNSTVKIVTRDYINGALKELKFTQSDLFDQKNIQRLGRFTKADYIVKIKVVGIETFNNSAKIQFSCINTETLSVEYVGLVTKHI